MYSVCQVKHYIEVEVEKVFREINAKNNEIISEVYVEFEKAVLRYFAKTNKDIIMCPNKNCTYLGFVKLNPCSKPLSCELCGFEWRDKSSYSLTERICRSLNPRYLGKSYMTKWHHFLFEKPCPWCGVMI